MGNHHSSSRGKNSSGGKNKKSKQQLVEREENYEFHLPKNSQDVDRMQLQHFLFEHVWQNNYSSPIEHELKSGNFKVLDAGCGPGTWLLEMSTQHPLTRFFGVDIAAVFPTEIKPTNLNFQQCDISRRLPFEDNYFDFVRMSLMSTSLKANQWISTIRELIRVLRPGGHLELVEKEIHAYDAGPHFAFVIKNIISFASTVGLDVLVTGRIPSILTSFPSLINVKSDYRTIPAGPLGGKSGEVYEDLLEMYYKNKLKDVLPKFMNISEKEYLHLWEKCQKEFTTHTTNIKLFRFWAQKVETINNNNIERSFFLEN